MDNLNTHPEHTDAPAGEQANDFPLDVPTSQILDNDLIGQQNTDMLLFWFSHEQHILHLDLVLQFHNEQVRVSLQLEMSIQNAALLNFLLEPVRTDVLIQIRAEIATLARELQRTQEDLETTQHHMDQALELVVITYEVNDSLISMLPVVQQETNSQDSSNELEDETSSVARPVEETTRRDLICKVCNSAGACMVLLPCQHVCVCKPCGDHLVACPICGAAKDHAVELTF